MYVESVSVAQNWGSTSFVNSSAGSSGGGQHRRGWAGACVDVCVNRLCTMLMLCIRSVFLLSAVYLSRSQPVSLISALFVNSWAGQEGGAIGLQNTDSLIIVESSSTGSSGEM